jgi:riboflavin biosynthesis pyrimidine reductase
MKHITKISVAAATFAVIGTSAALADDPHLQNRLAAQQRDTQLNQRSTTIAVYANRQGVGQRSVIQDDRSDVRFEWRTNPKGQGFGAYVPVK